MDALVITFVLFVVVLSVQSDPLSKILAIAILTIDIVFLSGAVFAGVVIVGVVLAVFRFLLFVATGRL